MDAMLIKHSAMDLFVLPLSIDGCGVPPRLGSPRLETIETFSEGGSGT